MNDGLKVVASLAATGLLLTFGWQYAVDAVLGGHTEQAVQNVEALKTASELEPSAALTKGAAASPSPPPAQQPASSPAPAGWQAGGSWGQTAGPAAPSPAAASPEPPSPAAPSN